jgi:hypothetical protein
MLRHICSNNRVLTCLGEVLVVALDGKWPGVEAGPVNLYMLVLILEGYMANDLRKACRGSR